VARDDELADGDRMIVTVNNRSIGIFNVGGKLFGLLNRCPHMGAELCKGEIVGNLSSNAPGSYEYDSRRKLLICPWHGWEFDLETGQSYLEPARVRARAYKVDVENGAAFVSKIESGEAGLTPSEYLALSGGSRHGESGERLPGPYRAETIPIVVEGDYIVVDLRRARAVPDLDKAKVISETL
jgi:nitrite reductase/ring-hydroxylating ferredoxin subunit